MPRSYDSDEQKLAGTPLTFSANIECPECGTMFEGHWTDPAIDVEQLVDPPIGGQKCPNPGCGASWDEEYPGWFNYGDAG